MSYCRFCANLPADNPHVIYHNTEYGFPVKDDRILFAALLWEIMQAGLNWGTILRKRPYFQAAFADYDIARIAQFDETKILALMNDAQIIRHRRKIEAVIFNAQTVLRLQEEYGSFYAWIETQKNQNFDQLLKTFKKHFHFVGKEILREFLLSTGFLPDAHDENCPVYQRIKSFQAA